MWCLKGNHGIQEEDDDEYGGPQLMHGKTAHSLGAKFDAANQTIPTVIQFSAPTYLCMEDHGKVTVRVVRLGDLATQSTADYTTIDGTARAGYKYEGSAGQLVFEPGQAVKEIDIQLLQDDRWDATMEFQVVLIKVTNAQIGLYLNVCRCQIIDDDSYPTNRWREVYEGAPAPHPYSKEYRHGIGPKLKGAKLMLEFVKLHLADSVILWNTLRFLFYDLIRGLYFFLTLYLLTYLIDAVFGGEGEGESGAEHGGAEHGGAEEVAENITHVAEAVAEVAAEHGRRLFDQFVEGSADRLARLLSSDGGGTGLIPEQLIVAGKKRETAVVIAALYIVPFLFVHLADWSKGYLEIPYRLRLTTQANLLAKFLNYKETKRGSLNAGETIMTMMRDATEVCEAGFMKIVTVFGIMIKMVMALIFVFSETKLAVIPLVCYPIVLGMFLWCRERRTIAVSEERARREDDVVQVVSQTVGNYRLIADFSLRSRAVHAYERSIERLHSQMVIMKSVVVNNMYVAPWLTTMLIGGWMIYGAFNVVSVGGTLTLGAWVATCNVFKEVGMEIMEIYVECMEIQRSFGPLEKICYYMNLETDLMDRMRTAQRMMEETGEKDITHMEDHQLSSRISEDPHKEDLGVNHRDFATDSLPIAVRDLSFQYSDEGAEALSNISASFEQGGLYAFVGEPHQGKGTLLKLLGQVLLPEVGKGQVIIPAHLRILHVAHSECLIDDNFLENVKLYGDIDLDAVHTTERLYAICKMVGLRDSLLELLAQPRKRAQDWGSQLTHTDFARLNLARAFIVNPECLVIHKPDMVFNHREVKEIMALLRQHVNERGLVMPAENRQFRRPRTVFYSVTTRTAMDIADRVFHVGRKHCMMIRRPYMVRVVSAAGLRGSLASSGAGKLDPYCVCELAYKPKSRSRTLGSKLLQSPMWNHEVTFEDISDNDVIHFYVMDQEISKLDVPSERLGFAAFHMKDLPPIGFAGDLRLEGVGPGFQAVIRVEISRLDVSGAEVRGFTIPDDP